MSAYMRALKPGGILSVTLWNKEEPPKSVLKLYATMAAAAREVDGEHRRARFFVASSYSLDRDRALQARRLHARGDRQAQRTHKAMSFDEIYYPGLKVDEKDAETSSRTTGTRSSPTSDGRPERHRGAQAPGGAAAGERRAAGHRHGPARLVLSRQRRLAEGGRPLRLRHPHPDQPPAVLRRLHQGEGPARSSPTGSSWCRTSGATCCCGRRSASPPSSPSRWCCSR